MANTETASTRRIGRFCLRTAVLALVPVLIALAVNAARPEPLPWLAPAPYEIYADCPETDRTAEAIALDRVTVDSRVQFVDARPAEQFKRAHLPGALSLPYDMLFPVETADIERVRRVAGSRRVIVVGEGAAAKLLADELVSGGLGRIRYVASDEDWTSLLPEQESEPEGGP